MSHELQGTAYDPGAVDHERVGRDDPCIIMARAIIRARRELPDAPVEDVMCRAEKIAVWLSSGEAASSGGGRS